MIVIGVCAGPTDRYERVAGPSLQAVAADDEVVVLRHQTSIAVAYNRILDYAVTVDGLEGVLLIHDDVELADPRWREALAEAFANPLTAVVGVIGGSGPGGMAWFTRREKRGMVREWPEREHDYGWAGAEVEVVDGLLLALSPWAARNLRFDERSYPPFHGYDADICARALAAGKRVAVVPLDVVHHTRGAFGTTKSYEDWIRAGLIWRLAWKHEHGLTRCITKLRRVAVPLEVRLRPSTRARRRDLKTRFGPSARSGPIPPSTSLGAPTD